MKRMLTMVLMGALLLAPGACGKDSTGPVNTAAGRWTGTGHSGDVTFTLTLTLTQTPEGRVSGSGTIAAAGDAVALNASGVFNDPTLSLTLTASGFEDMNLTATVAGSAATGTLNGSGFTNSSVTLTKQ